MPCCSRVETTPIDTSHPAFNRPYFSFEKIALFATLFFVLSGAGVGVLYGLHLTQYLPAPLAIGGISFFTLLIVVCKSDSCKCASKRATTPSNDEAPQTRERKSTETYKGWKEQPVPTSKKGRIIKVDETFTDEASSATPIIIDDRPERGHPLQLTAVQLGRIKKHAEMVSPLFVSLKNHLDSNLATASKEPHFDLVDYLKTNLWALCIADDEDKLNGHGLNLIGTGNRPIFVPMQENCTNSTRNRKLYCVMKCTTDGDGKIAVQQKGLIAHLLTDLREQLKKAFPGSI